MTTYVALFFSFFFFFFFFFFRTLKSIKTNHLTFYPELHDFDPIRVCRQKTSSFQINKNNKNISFPFPISLLSLRIDYHISYYNLSKNWALRKGNSFANSLANHVIHHTHNSMWRDTIIAFCWGVFCHERNGLPKNRFTKK